MKKAAKKASNAVVWTILVLLMIGLAGFGVTNFGGRVTSIGSVGDEKIPVDDYARALDTVLRDARGADGGPISLQEAEARGLLAQARGQVISTAALDDELRRVGISASDEMVSAELAATQAFQGGDGGFSREVYRQVLDSNGLDPASYEARIREAQARGLLRRAVGAPAAAPATYQAAMAAYLGERRRFTRAGVTADMLEAAVPDPTEAQLAGFHEANADAYTRPRTKRLSYVWVTPAMLADEVDVSEEELRRAYDRNRARFEQPERRIVERLVFSDRAAADAAKARLGAGEAGFGDLVAARGLSLGDVDMGPVTRGELSGTAAEAVFGAGGPGVVGPVESALGPALFRVSAILPARTTPFEEAAVQLRPALARDEARTRINELVSPLEDDLAAGATLGELAASTPLGSGEMEFTAASREGPAADPAFRAAAREAQPGDFPELIDLDNGGLAALRVEGVIEPRLQPLADIRDQVAKDWRAGERRRRLGERAEALAARIESGESFDSLGLTPEEAGPVTRRELSPQALADAVFATPEGRTGTAVSGDTATVVRVDAVLPPEPDGEAAATAAQLASQAGSTTGQDILTAFTRMLVAEKGVNLDQSAINAVQAQIGPGEGHSGAMQ